MQPRTSIDFFQALRAIQAQAKIAELSENATVQSIRRINESFGLVDSTPEIEQRALGTAKYLVTYPNLLSNGSFETDLTGWTEDIDSGITATTQRTTAEAKKTFASLASLQVDITASSNTGIAGRYQDLTAAAAEIWNFELWVKGSTFTNARSELFVEWLGPGGSVLGTVQVTSGSFDESFELLKAENEVAPSSTLTARVYGLVRVTTSGGTGKAWFDLVRAEKGAITMTDRARRIIAGEWVVRS